MDIFTEEKFKELLSADESTCVSIYMPTYEKGGQVRQNAIRFKNLLNRTQQLIEERIDDRSGRINLEKKILKPMTALLENPSFDYRQGKGLAVFAAEDRLEVFRLPLDLPELVVVADQYHLKPLLPLVINDPPYFVLTITQEQALLFRCTKQLMEKIDTPEMPRGLADTLKFDEVERQQQFYTGQPVVKGKQTRSAVFHGQDVVNDLYKERLRRYCQDIAKAVHKSLARDRAPLLVVSFSFLLPIYETVNMYPHLLENGLPHNPDVLAPAELHSRTLTHLDSVRQEGAQQALNRYNNFKGTGKTSNDIAAILHAAIQGKVAHLFFSLQTYLWGTVDAATDKVDIHDDPQSGDQDLINAAARITYQNGGSLWPLSPEAMPDGAGCAALLY